MTFESGATLDVAQLPWKPFAGVRWRSIVVRAEDFPGAAVRTRNAQDQGNPVARTLEIRHANAMPAAREGGAARDFPGIVRPVVVDGRIVIDVEFRAVAGEKAEPVSAGLIRPNRPV